MFIIIKRQTNHVQKIPRRHLIQQHNNKNCYYYYYYYYYNTNNNNNNNNYYYYYKNKNWLQFLFIVKAAVLKQQISKFYPQILSTEDSFYIYERPLTEIYVIASFCALNLRIKF